MPAAGVPLSVPVPSPLSTNVTPLGSAAPPCTRLGNGKPLAVTVKVFTAPIANVVELALVITGPSVMVSVKVWVTGPPTPLVAVNVSV